ncbi:precorrin-2 dehydrogenase/sirohydrochlorin ferrochelatase family protein [Actinomarinicola tropica]|uniref:precorrin-2 dehydrogenase n=1 Tax=Actinomarinicola tropica TaxID=2789776 RepID=A0A5Q2RQM9_9ACTN|nr:NAD(P)-dependent oxidoreductase [Actinomarinicola tropica]QGG96200.1 hypothetical protein GH723_14425 [Actinomarinicola tropica]
MPPSAPAPHRTSTRPGLTVALHLDGRRAVVVGAGHVGVRRALQLAEVGADVTLVSPEVWPRSSIDELLSQGITWFAREYEPADVEGATIVVAATGRSDVDAAVLRDAAAAGAMANHVADATAGDFSLVATTDLGHIQVSVSTAGRTPALTRWIRDRLAAELSDGYPALVELFAEVREELRAAGRPTRHRGWEDALSGGVLDQVRAGDVEGARVQLRRHLELA